MADNKLVQSGTNNTLPTGTRVSTKEVTHSGDTTDVQLVELVSATGTEGSRTLNEITDANGVNVNLQAGDGTDLTETAGALDVNVASGTVTANLSATDNAVLDQIEVNTSYGDNTGGGTEAGALRVTIANDSTGVVTVDDGGGSLTVDGTVTANAGTGTFTVDGSGVTQPISAASLPLPSGAATAANQLPDGHNVTIDNASGASAVNIQDGGNSITVDNAGLTELAAAINTNQLDVNIATDSVGIGGGVQYVEDDAAASNPTGSAQILVRTDTPTTQTTTDGDNVARRGTNYGAALTQIVDSSGNFIDTFGGSGGTAAADDSDFVAGTTQGTLVQGVYESSPTSVTDGDMGAIGIDANRAVKVRITADDAGIGGGTQYTDDTSTHATGTSVGNLLMAAATPTDSAVDANDIGSVAMSTDRRLHVDSQIVGTDAALDVSAATVTVDNGGTFAVQENGAALTALQVIDNTVKIDDAAFTLTTDSVNMAGAIRDGVTGVLSAAEGDAVPLRTNRHGALWVADDSAHESRDVFGRSIVSLPNNDIDVQFFRGDPDTLVEVTTANSATATAANGGASFASSTNANGSVQGVTSAKTVYRSGGEIYVMFTASFTAGIANSYQRIGLYDANNGFFIGYEGTSFGVTYRSATSDTTVAKGSFSEDALTGGTNSKFTRAGTPEAIDLTKLNIYRIRFGWLGSAPCYWEVMAPDGHWVCFHKTLFPNLQGTPSIEDADLPMTIDITKTAAAATDLVIQTDCWGAGSMLSEQNGIIDVTNSRAAATLSAGTSWNAAGPFTDIHRYAMTTFLVYSSTASASGTLTVDFSMDASTVHRSISYTVTDANDHPPHTLIPIAQYVRVSYTANGGGGDTHSNFTVQTIHHVHKSSKLTSRVTQTINDSTDVENTRSVIVGKTGGGSYVNIGSTAGGSLKANIEEIGENTIATNTGTADAGTQRVTIATDDTVTVDNAGTFAAQIDAALPAGDNNIGNVDIVTLPKDGQATMANSIPVAIASDQATLAVNTEFAGAVAFSDAKTPASSPPVGSFPHVYNGATWDMVRGDTTNGLDVDVTRVGGTVTVDNAGTFAVQVDAALPAGDNNIGNVDIASSVALDVSAATVTVDLGSNNDVVVTGNVADDAAASGNPVLIAGYAIETDGTDPGEVSAEGDAAQLRTDLNRRILVNTNHPNNWTANGEYTTAQTDTSIKAAPGANLHLYITDIVVSTDGEFNCFFEQSTTKLIGPLYLAANGGAVMNFTTPIRLPANTALTFTSSATANHSITVNGYTAP